MRSLGRPLKGALPPGRNTIDDDAAQQWIPSSPGYLYDVDSISDSNERFFCSEIVRGCLLESLGKEVPYCCEVQIVEYREPREGEKRVTKIRANILVERNSQKGTSPRRYRHVT